MAGLINTAMAAPDNVAASNQQQVQQAKSNLKDPNLQQIDSQIQERIPADSRQMYLATVAAGMRLAFDPKLHDRLIKGLQSSNDIIKNIALVTTGIIGTVFTESKQDVNAFAKAMIPAAITLMCDIMQFASDSGMLQITPDAIAKCASMTSDAVLKKFGVDQKKVQSVVAAGKQSAGQQTMGA